MADIFSNGVLSNKTLYNYQVAPLILEKKSFDVYSISNSQWWSLGCVCAAFIHALDYGADMNTVLVVIYPPHGYDKRSLDLIFDVIAKPHVVANMNLSHLSVYKLRLGVTVKDIVGLWNQLSKSNGKYNVLY